MYGRTLKKPIHERCKSIDELKGEHGQDRESVVGHFLLQITDH